jgi:orotate phosphoribosyltransferase
MTTSESAQLSELEVAALLERKGAMRWGHFALSSGLHSDTYIQCALALGNPDLAHRLGRALAAKLTGTPAPGEIAADVVVAPALGGLLAGFTVAAALARPFVFTERDRDRVMALRRGQTLGREQRVLVVEDVVTTGGSAAEAAAVCEAAGASVVGAAALVDRSDGQPALAPLTSLLTVEADEWEPEECPECRRGNPVDSPGSRER